MQRGGRWSFVVGRSSLVVGRWSLVVGRWLGPVEGIGIHEKYFDGDFFWLSRRRKNIDPDSGGQDFSQWLREFVKSVDS